MKDQKNSGVFSFTAMTLRLVQNIGNSDKLYGPIK